MRIRMRLITEPLPGDSASLSSDFGTDPIVIRGTGPNDFICGRCDAVLLDSVHLGQVGEVVVRCASCLAWNQAPVVAGGD